MTKAYAIEEIRDIMKELHLTMQWLADKVCMTRQGVYNVFAEIVNEKTTYKHLLLFTYILNDYIENELCETVHEVKCWIDKKKKVAV